MQKHDNSTDRSYHHPPIFDINNLDEEHEIRIEYDSRGNPTRIRKVRRYEGCTAWLAFGILLAFLIGWAAHNM